MRISHAFVFSIHIAFCASNTWAQPDCDCHLVECNENGQIVTSFWTSTPVQAVVNEGDTVENQIVFDRDMDVRPAMFVRAEEFQEVEDAIGIQADMDGNGDGWMLMELNFSLNNRIQFNAGACTGFSTPIHQLAAVIVGSDNRQRDRTWPFYLPAGWSDAPVEVDPTIHYQPNSEIRTKLVHVVDEIGDSESDDDESDSNINVDDVSDITHIRVMKFAGDLLSADRNTELRFEFRYTGDLPFGDRTFNLRDRNFTIPVTNGQYQYCYLTRTRATIEADDPNLSMSLELEDDRICLPLNNMYGDPICLRPRKVDGKIELHRLRVIRYAGIECEVVDTPDESPEF